MRSFLLSVWVFCVLFGCYGAYAEDFLKRPSCKCDAIQPMRSNLGYVYRLSVIPDAYEYYISSIDKLYIGSHRSKNGPCSYLKLLDYKTDGSVKGCVGCGCCLMSIQTAYPEIVLYKDGKEVYRTRTYNIREMLEILNTAY